MFDRENPIRVLGISGSLRERSYNTAALRVARELMPDDMVLELASIDDFPFYNADDERVSGFPDSVARVRAQTETADALLIATPEYNYSVTGALKNAVDWLSRPPDPPINLKPAAILGVGGRLGTSRAQQHLRDIARHNDLRLVQKPEVLISGAWEKFDDELNLTDDRSRDQVERLILALRGLTIRIKATRKRVLLVGRDDSNLGRLVTLLRELGYEPVAVFDDESALEMIDPGQFAIVLIADEVPGESRASIDDYARHIAPSTKVLAEIDHSQLAKTLEETQ